MIRCPLCWKKGLIGWGFEHTRRGIRCRSCDHIFDRSATSAYPKATKEAK